LGEGGRGEENNFPHKEKRLKGVSLKERGSSHPIGKGEESGRGGFVFRGERGGGKFIFKGKTREKRDKNISRKKKRGVGS